jgi:hypothetical protein
MIVQTYTQLKFFIQYKILLKVGLSYSGFILGFQAARKSETRAVHRLQPVPGMEEPCPGTQAGQVKDNTVHTVQRCTDSVVQSSTMYSQEWRNLLALGLRLDSYRTVQYTQYSVVKCCTNSTK